MAAGTFFQLLVDAQRVGDFIQIVYRIAFTEQVLGAMALDQSVERGKPIT